MSLRDIEFPKKDEPLRQDVHLLGDMVGKVIREQDGDKLFGRVEAARHAAIARREGTAEATGALRHALADLTPTDATAVVRAFSAYFQVVNLAERVHRIRRGRHHARSEDGAQAGSLLDTVEQLRAMGVSADEAYALFADARVEPVFTAHPTEATRRIILEKQERIAGELIARLDPSRTPHQERVALARIREDITTAWQTDETPEARPTVTDEREHVLYYVSRVIYRVIPALHERLDDAIQQTWPDAPARDLPALVHVASWVGGDMDGNPNVDADTIRGTLQRHRELALLRYEMDVAELARQLSQSASRVQWSEGVDEIVARYGEWFPQTLRSIPRRHASMGYRVALELVRARLGATRTGSDRAYSGPHELRADVEALATSLEQNKGRYAGLFGVRRLLRRIRAFGFHMAVLDIRQDARELRDVMAELLDDVEWPTRPADERIQRLHQLIRGSAMPARDVAECSPRVRRALEVFSAIGEGKTTYGPHAVGPFIISMAQDVDDVLTVLWLAARGGLGSVEGLGTEAGPPLDVAPLLETVPDLERAEEILDRLFTDEVVAPHVGSRGNQQMVMVGYSDSNKDGGVASARWALQQALARMARAATRHQVRLTVFHGRGGTVSRGGGSVERAVAAMPAASIGGRLRLTEQGEVIDAKYGLPQIALRNFERMLGAIVLRAAPDSIPSGSVDEAWVRLGDAMAAAARQTYRSLVYDDPRFTAYFRGGTPIDVIERMAIGSRPASRRAGAGVEDLRAIPWVFAWTQCRATLTGWFGLGTGLDAAAQEVGMKTLVDAAARWPFFNALLADVEMVLAKSDLEIARSYTPLVPVDSQPVFGVIEREFAKTVDWVLRLRNATELLESEPTLQRSIRLRNPYVDPMNVLQVALLDRWRSEGRPEGPLLDALLATVSGIARGLQNTG